MVQQLEVHSILVEDLNSVPSTHVRWLTCKHLSIESIFCHSAHKSIELQHTMTYQQTYLKLFLLKSSPGVNNGRRGSNYAHVLYFNLCCTIN